MKQAVKKGAENNLDNHQQMLLKSVAHGYSSQRERFVHKSVYHTMPEFWLRKIFRGVIYANSNLLAKPLKRILSENVVGELPHESRDLYKRTMIDCHIDRLALEIIERLCFVQFLKKR